MDKIQPGKYIELTYDLYEIQADGSDKLVHQVDPSDPEKIVYGVTRGVIAPLEVALNGMEQGGQFDVKVSAEEAFGPYDPEQVIELDRSVFEIDGKFDQDNIKKGAVVPMMTADGYRVSGIVEEVGTEKVKMDFNHPLAGKAVRFKGNVTLVRDATPEELQPSHGCGCGCHDGGCSEEGCAGGCHDGCCH